MSRKQIYVLWTGVILIGLLLMVPPWKYIIDIPNRLHVEKPGPYSQVWSPPEIPVTSRTQYGETFNGYTKDRWSVRLDTNRMALPVSFVVIVTATVLITLRNKLNKNAAQ
jgi:hypothetical protein